MNKRDEVIEEAQSLINGDRLDVYGDPVKNFETIAHLWKPIFGEVTAQQVGLALLQLKVARATTAPDHMDSYVDMIGYAALTAEVQTKSGKDKISFNQNPHQSITLCSDNRSEDVRSK